MTDNLLINEIPEKFKDPETGDIRLDVFVKSYKELEKKLSNMPSGHKAPTSHEEYCIDCEHGMFKPDAEVNQRLHEKGFSNEQAQEVYDLAADKMMPMIMDLMAEFQADREVEKLINHYGGKEQWKEVSRQLLAYGQRNLSPEVFANLSSSFEGVMALHRMMQSDEPGLKNNSDTQPAGQPDTSELQSMMRDPRYWRDKDPSFVKQVTEGFKTMYGSE